jgi:hypothetical protein
MKKLECISFVLALIALAGCSGGDDGSGSSSDAVHRRRTRVVLQSISVAPASSLLNVGDTVQLTATGSFSNGTTQDITQTATWTASDANVASVSAGLVTTLAAGNVTITASMCTNGVCVSGTSQVTAVVTGNGACAIVVPDDPLSANGLSTPYQLFGSGCTMADPNNNSFVEATILDLDTGALSVYHPLVVDFGTDPAVAPVVPALPANNMVVIYFGSNGVTLQQVDNNGGTTLAAANCVNGLGGQDLFGQVSFCNAANFYSAANAAIAAGTLAIPALGTGNDGQPCITVRDFGMVDQDQSDNVVTKYLLTPGGQVAQNTAANAAAFPGSTILFNGSDNASSIRYQKAIGCTPFEAPTLDDAPATAPSQALDELFAAANQQAPIATVPMLDPMVLVGGQPNFDKQNAYRIGVDQAPFDSLGDAQAAQTDYCTQLLAVGAPRLQLDQTQLTNTASPFPNIANNFFTFLCQRWNTTWSAQGLDCVDSTGTPSPIVTTTDANGVFIDCTINL